MLSCEILLNTKSYKFPSMIHSTRERKDDGGNIQYLTVSQWFL